MFKLIYIAISQSTWDPYVLEPAFYWNDLFPFISKRSDTSLFPTMLFWDGKDTIFLLV